MSKLTDERLQEVIAGYKEIIENIGGISQWRENIYRDGYTALTELLSLRDQLRWRKYPEEKPEEGQFIEFATYYDEPLLCGITYCAKQGLLDSNMLWRPSDYPPIQDDE